MDVDIAQVQYFVELITETGDIYELDNAIQTLAWEEQEGQLAQKATITISSHSTENGAGQSGNGSTAVQQSKTTASSSMTQ